MTDFPPVQAGERASVAPGKRPDAPPIGSRIAAGGALVISAATLVILIVFTARDLPYVLASVLAGALSISALWIAATNRRFRWVAAAAAVLLVGAAIASLVAAGRGAAAVAVVIVGIVVASGLGTLALRWEVREALAKRWHEVPPTSHGVVLMNPRSGDGKVARLHLADEARRRGIEPVLLDGGDGSQAVVAAVAARRGLPFVCIPAGTRNHLALDLGIDRDDPARALDAFGPAKEATIDLGEVNGEIFVNNVSLGLYARIVARESYREAKRRTVAELLPDL